MYDRTAEKRPGAANYRLLSMEVGELRAMPVSVGDTRNLAREVLPGDVWDFVEGGAEHESALADGPLTARDGLHGDGRSQAISAAETVRRLGAHLASARTR